ncbi:MAG: hypothetical protein HY770_03950 [Chitinivibrionia bacterium]|nr:hypothetical protein [Chitinivibrionia bacterium]
METRRSLLFMFGVCACCFLWTAQAAGFDIVMHEISADITPADHYLKARDKLTIKVEEPGSYALLIGEPLGLRKVILDGKRIRAQELYGDELRKWFPGVRDDAAFDGAKGFVVDIERPGKHYLDVSYEGTVYDTLKVPDYSRGRIPEETSGIISEQGAYLSGGTHWYPDRPEDMAAFYIKMKTPRGFESVTEGKRTERSPGKMSLTTRWEALYPTKDVTAVAGPYLIHEEKMDGIAVMAYFFESEQDLVQEYVDASKRYIDLYNNLIGPYPFSKFAIVENFFPTGYGMPSYTLLGKRVIRLPFIVHTSLGHEVAHNWWGNSVYPDYATGNWCEGLTVYYADHRYKEAVSDSAAIDYRRTLDTDYTVYVHEGNDFPLTLFGERTTPASRAIGYGKSAFVFHMLKKIVGEEAFYRSFRTFYERFQFKTASWRDIEAVCEAASGRDLGFFFSQWVDSTGAPAITLADAVLDSARGGYRVRVTVKQDSVYRILLPVSIAGADTAVDMSAWIASPETTLVFETEFRPRAVHIDPYYDIFRRLSPFEIPPTISAVLGDKDVGFILPTRADPGKRRVFEALADQLHRTGEGVVMEDTTVTVADLEKRSLLILGDRAENALLSIIGIPSGIELAPGAITVAGASYGDPEHGAFVAMRSPFNPAKSICVIAGGTGGAVEKAGYKIIHYGKYGYVVFCDGQKVDAGILPVLDNPMIRAFD